MPRSTGRYVLCVRNESYRASLQPRKVYRVLEDAAAESHSLLRVVDESGEDYLFPAALFVPIELPAKARLCPVLLLRSESPCPKEPPSNYEMRLTRSAPQGMDAARS